MSREPVDKSIVELDSIALQPQSKESKKETRAIDRFIIMGDSLSDKGTMEKSVLAPFSGLYGTSPDGRFTNGYVWQDFFTSQVMVDALDVNSAAASKPKSIFTENDDEIVTIKTSQDYCRTYCKGGMTAHNYSRRISKNLMIDGEELVLATLEEMFEQVEKDDKAMNISEREKSTTLVI